jgi:hypothetical protein
MIAYKDVEYETSESLRDTINNELAQLAYPYKVSHKAFGEGQLTFVKAPLNGGSLYATVEFEAGTKTLSMDVLLANQLLEMPEILMDVLLEAQSVFKADFVERTTNQLRANITALEQAHAEKKKAAKEKAAEEKKEAKKIS